MASVVFVFLDGVGMGEGDANPFLAADMPFLDSLLDRQRPHAHQPRITTDKAAAFPVDACLGVAGRPQSATGQAAIVSGRNVPLLLGEHYGPKPNARIRGFLDHTMFSRLRTEGVRVHSANAYPPPFFEGVRSGRRLLSAIPYALQAAGIELNGMEAYRDRRAVSGTITGRDWHERLGLHQMPVHEPYAAGRIVGRLATTSSLVFFEHWMTDYYGHKRMFEAAVANFGRIDGFLQGLTDAVDLSQTLIVIGSDHGNVEDCGHGRHTRNPALGMAWGSGFQAAPRRVQNLTDFRELVESHLLDA